MDNQRDFGVNDEVQFRNLQESNFNLRTENEKLRQENRLVKNKFSEQQADLQKVKEENNRLGQEAKAACGKNNEQLKAARVKSENLEKEIANLKRKNSEHESSSANDKKRITELTEKVGRKEKKLGDESGKVADLKNEVKIKSEELSVLQKKCNKAQSRQKSAEETVTTVQEENERLKMELEDSKNKHVYLFILTEMQDKMVEGLTETREKLTKQVESERDKRNKVELELCTVQKQLEQSKLLLEQANATISDKDKEISECQATIKKQIQDNENKKLLESRVKSEDSKINCRQEIMEMQAKKIAKQDADIKAAADLILELKEKSINNDNIEAEMNKVIGEKTSLETAVNQLKTEQDQILKFAESVKDCVKFSGNEEQFSINKLEGLAEHIQEKMKELEQLNGLGKRRKISDPKAVHTSEDGEYSVPLQTPPSSSTSSYPPLTPFPSPVLPPCNEDAGIMDVNDDERLLQNGQKNQKNMTSLGRISNTSKKILKHAEDVKKRLPGRGKENLGAKYYCICTFVCASSSKLESHIRHASQKKNIKRDMCPKRFRQQIELKHSHSETETSTNQSLEQQQSIPASSVRDVNTSPEQRSESKERMDTHEDNENIISAGTISPHNHHTVPPSLPMESGNEHGLDHLMPSIPTTSNSSSSFKHNIINLPKFSTSTEIKFFPKKHAIDPSKENNCLCGIPFRSPEALAKHIEFRSKRL